MVNTIFKKVPFNKIVYRTRPTLIKQKERQFYNTLKKSIQEKGLLDPLFLFNICQKDCSELRVNIGHSRMTICKELEIKMIPCIITQLGNEDIFLKGKILKTNSQIRKLYYLPKEVVINRREDGWIQQGHAKTFMDIQNKYKD